MNDVFINLYAVRNNKPYSHPDMENVFGMSYGLPFPCKDDESAVKSMIQSLQQSKVTFNPADFDLCLVARFYPFAKKPVSVSIGKPKVVCHCKDVLGSLYNEGGDAADA